MALRIHRGFHAGILHCREFDFYRARIGLCVRQADEFCPFGPTGDGCVLVCAVADPPEPAALRDLVLDSFCGTSLTWDTTSTPWLEGLVWKQPKQLGYGRHFTSTRSGIIDDHTPFLKNGVAAADVIDFSCPYWHTRQDTLARCSPHSIAVVGHVFLETIKALDKKFSPHSER